MWARRRRGGGHVLGSAASWYDAAWGYRQVFAASNPNATALTDYQVNVTLGAASPVFARALSDGSDLRICGADGTTLLPYWVESYDAAGKAASLWVRVPSIPASGRVLLHLYYGNASPALFDLPPLGPWAKSASNPIVTGSALSGKLAENIAFDAGTGKYWLVYTDSTVSPVRVGAAWTTDFVTWTDAGAIYTPGGAGANSPHLILSGGTWYLFWHDTSVYYVTASAPDGVYGGKSAALIAPSAITGRPGYVGWETQRVTEVYVFPRPAPFSDWCMLYMGDVGLAAQSCGGAVSNNQETVGYATAPAVTGPWTKYSLNPVMGFGATGEFDSCTVADPWCVYLNGVYYIGYSAGKAGSNVPWVTAVYTTTDWVTFTRGNVALGRGSQNISSAVGAETFDSNNAHRGAVIRVADTYYLTYTGIPVRGTPTRYGIGIASMSAKSTIAGYPPQQVFGFYEDFATAGALPSHLRANVFATTYTTNPAPASQTATAVAGGVLGLSSGKVNTSVRPYSRVLSAPEFGPGSLVEARIQHPNADGTATVATGLGFGDDSAIAPTGPFWVAGPTGYNGGFSFIGNNNTVVVGNPNAIKITGNTGTGTALTLEFWCKLNSNRVQGIVFGKNGNWLVYFLGDSTHAGKINVSWNGAVLVAPTTNVVTSADLGVWVHWAIDYSTTGGVGTSHIWKNGVPLTISGTFNADLLTTVALALGQRGDTANWLDGALADVRISSSIRYVGAFTPPSAPFVADGTTALLYHGDEGSGVALTDASGNGNNGTVTGAKAITLHAYENANWMKGYANTVGARSAMAQAVDTSYHTQRVWWRTATEARYQVDSNAWESIVATLPVGTLPAWVGVSARNDGVALGGLNVDWLRVRKLADSEPVILTGAQQAHP